jgi:hypothetical protein
VSSSEAAVGDGQQRVDSGSSAGTGISRPNAEERLTNRADVKRPFGGCGRVQTMARSKWPGFELKYLDWLMCRSHSEVVGIIIGEASGIALLLSIGRSFAHFATPPPHFSLVDILYRAAGLAVITSPFGIGAWWTVRTWKRLWRCGRTPRERLIYDFGVRGYGVGMAAAISCLVTWLGWTTDANSFGPIAILGALASIFFGVPVSLNMGYFWGSAFAKVYGMQADLPSKLGEPPHVYEKTKTAASLATQ